MKKNKGFSLIELMIVISIISILSVIAIPSYQNYTKKARFAEVISATSSYKTAVSLALQEGFNSKELNNNMHGIPDEPTPTRNLASLKVENGIITAQATDLIDNTTYILTPNENGSQWTISGTCLDKALCEI